MTAPRKISTETVSPTELEPDDFRSGDRFPRVGPEHRVANAELAQVVAEVAAARDATPSQVALAWLLTRRPWIVPIPGTKRVAYIEDNAGAPAVVLTAEDLARLDELAANAEGNRYGVGGSLPNWVSPPLG